MNNSQISMPQGNCLVSVSYNKRVVSLLRTGKKGETSKHASKFPGEKRKTKSNEPEFERGWVKVTHTNVQMLKVVVSGGNPSASTRREFNMPKEISFEQACIGHIHDLAYECARAHGCHLLGWQCTNVETGQTLTVQGEWEGDKFIYKITSK